MKLEAIARNTMNVRMNLNHNLVRFLQIISILLMNTEQFLQAHHIDSSTLARQEQQHEQKSLQNQHQIRLMPLKLSSAKTQLELPPSISQESSTILPPPSTTTTSTATTTTTTTTSITSNLNPTFEQTSATATSPTKTLESNTKIPSKNWIEKILIRVEDINLDEEREKHRLSATSLTSQSEDTDEHPQVETDEDNIGSQAPTDSGEDPLELATTTSTILSNVTGTNEPSTQYSLTIAQAPKPNGPYDTDETVVDSNNVSALLKAQQEQRVSSHLDVVQVDSKQTISCEQAYTQCALRKACAPALKAYNDDCQDLVNNQTNQCTPKCLRAMIALRSSEEGGDLMNCDCQANEYCLQSKQRSQVCKPEVEQAIDPKTIVSCSTASWICMADQLCSTALDYYYRFCQTLFSERHCSMRCNNSLAILYRQPKASKLINCQCDGSEELPCAKYKAYTERLCLNKQTTTTPTVDAGGNDQTDAADLPDEDIDGSNLTNEPATFQGQPQIPTDHSSPFGDSVIFKEGEKEDENSGDNDTVDSTPSDTNGIQLVEDNWIPLISGRYFTNLHHRQQQQQQYLQQQQKVRQQQRQTSGKQTNQRKPPKGGKHRTKNNSQSHDNKTRRAGGSARLFALASTSSGSFGQNRIGYPLVMVSVGFNMVVVNVVVALFNVVYMTSGPY